MGADVGAHVVDEGGIDGEQAAVAVRGQGQVPMLFAGVVGGQEVLAAVLDPAHRPAEPARQVGNEEVLGIELAAGAEAAAHVALDEADLVLADVQQVGQHAPVEVRNLGHTPHRHSLATGVPLGKETPGLHGQRGVAAHRERAAEHARGGPDDGVDVTEVDDPRGGQVAVGVKRWRSRTHGPERVDHSRQGCVVDLDKIACVLGHVRVGGDDYGHRFADVAHGVEGERCLQVTIQLGAPGHAYRDHA